MLRLAELLTGLSSQPARVISYEGSKERNSADFLTQVGQFRELVQDQGHRWGVYLQNSCDFAACFMGLLAAGKQPVILPNAQPSFLSQLGHELDAVLLDQPREGEHYFSLEQLPEVRAEFDWTLPPDLTLALFTSGSTGKPKKIEKTLANIESELATLESVWGSLTEGAVSFSTVSHQHIYGLLFQVLWPLCSGKAFDAQIYSYPSDLFQRLVAFPKAILVSSPSHLNRLPKLVELEPHGSRISALFSSGGPMDRRAALQIRDRLKRGVTEVFGSTETGGVAYRTQSENTDSKLWLPFEVVELRSETGKLSIRSPYVDPNSWYQMEDRVALAEDGRFELLGRADRVVKIEGKRVSLDEIESRLKASELVQQARALVLTGPRSSIGVVLVPSERGKEMMDKGETPGLKGVLKEELGSYFERVLLPRKWRVVEELPVNQQGKTTQDNLRMVFEEDKIEMPVVLAVREAGQEVEMDLLVPEDTRYFDGHFPGRPLLPGIAQVDWAADFGQQYFQPAGPFRGLEAVKFHQFIEPNTKIKLALKYRPEKQKISFAFTGDNAKYSSGRILFG